MVQGDICQHDEWGFHCQVFVNIISKEIFKNDLQALPTGFTYVGGREESKRKAEV